VEAATAARGAAAVVGGARAAPPRSSEVQLRRSTAGAPAIAQPAIGQPAIGPPVFVASSLAPARDK